MTSSGPSPTLLIFSGLPGSGKSTLARLVARRLRATYLRIDTIEQAIRDLCSLDVQAEGYCLAYRVAADNLGIGQLVVADACNPIELTRREWEHVALDSGATFVNIEVCCSDAEEHRVRVESRTPEVPGLRLPTWAEVRGREYDPWTTERIFIDTAGRSEAASLRELLGKLDAAGIATDRQSGRR